MIYFAGAVLSYADQKVPKESARGDAEFLLSQEQALSPEPLWQRIAEREQKISVRLPPKKIARYHLCDDTEGEVAISKGLCIYCHPALPVMERQVNFSRNDTERVREVSIRRNPWHALSPGTAGNGEPRNR